jgi:hypothetical protein
MPAWPKTLLSLGASLLTARMAGRLRRSNDAPAAQQHTFRALKLQLARTSFWREAGIEPGLSYEAFRSRIAPRSHAYFGPAIERMKCGEADVLWPGRCAFYAASAGTAGQEKTVPVTNAMLAHFRRAGRDALLHYTARVGHAGLFRGQHLFLTGSTTLTPISESGPHRSFVGQWPAIAALNLPRWAERHLCALDATMSGTADWDAKLAAVTARAAQWDISLLSGMPNWLLGFAQALRDKPAESGRRIDTLQAIWPNLECCVHGGIPVGPFQKELRAILGPSVNFHEVYAAAEGIFAAQDNDPNTGLRVLSDAGLFFEFLPFTDFEEARIEHLGAKVVPLADVRTGVDYVVLLTSPSGLVRYVVGDVVRFTSVAPPRFVYAGRTRLQLSAFSERMLEKELTDALVTVCHRHDWSIVNFHVAPLFGRSLTGQARGRHEWWIELRPGTVETPTGPLMAVELDAELQRLSSEYTARRKTGQIETPIVRLVMPGVFEHWLRFHAHWGGQNKIARCRSDRIIADELAQITNFARD